MPKRDLTYLRGITEYTKFTDETLTAGIRAYMYFPYCTIKARFKRRILHAPNAIQTMHNEEAYLIIYCLNCIRCMQNSRFETGLNFATKVHKFTKFRMLFPYALTKFPNSIVSLIWELVY